jgi:hypothetical protein
MLPEDGRRPKHVGTFKYFSVCFLNTENISAFVGFSWKIEIEMHGATMKTGEHTVEARSCNRCYSGK